MKLFLRDTYLAMIRNSVGSSLFRTLYAEVGGEKKDILRDGDLSCAFFVSSILHHFSLVKGVHATVAGLTRDLEDSGWQVTTTPREGAVVIWAPEIQKSGEAHPHAGFYLSESEAISHSDVARTPVVHSLTARSISAMYTHEFLA